uniref:Uncharacterized protein n=1 Tax=Knipowitschia caucasica TaxID=637954 RepID=A0AAV2KJ77_KNICA
MTLSNPEPDDPVSDDEISPDNDYHLPSFETVRFHTPIPSNLKVKRSTYQMDRTNKDGNRRPLILNLTYLLNHLLSPTHLIFSFQTKTHLNLPLILSIPRLQPNLKEAPEYATHPKDFSTPIWAIPS